MKIVHFTFMRSSKYGGMERFFVKLALDSQADGDKHIIVYNSQPFSQEYINDLQAAGGEIAIIPPCGWLKLFFQYRKFIIREQPDAVQSYFNYLAAFITLFAAFLAGVKKRICSFHTLSPNTFKTRIIFRFLNWLSTDIISVSEGTKRSFEVLIPRKSPKHKVLYMGIEPDKTDTASAGSARKELNIPDDAVVFVNTAFSNPIKGIDILIKAFVQVASLRKNVWLLQIGSDKNDDFIEILSQAGSEDIRERVIFLGLTDHVAKYLPAMDIFVLSSRSEAMPLALMEAAAAGLPLIGSNIGGIPEIIIDGENGFTFPAEDVQALQQKMLTLIDDQALRQKFAGNSRKIYSNNFCLEKQAAVYNRFYRGGN